MSKAGWQTKNFSDVLDIKNGRNQKEVESDSGEYPIFGSAGNVMGYANAYICEAGTTIVGRKGNINSPIYAETRFWNVDTAFGLAAKPGLDSKFLYYYCLSFDFGALNRGTTIPSLVKSELLGISIPFPPLPEQHRIVAILDAAFDHIATARANCEANLLNARAIFESHLQGVFTQRGEGWEVKSFDEVLVIKNGRDQKPVEKIGGKYPIYGSAGNVMGWTDAFICDEQTTIIGRKGTINKPLFIETKFWNVDTAFGLAAKPNLNAKFLYFFCLSYDFSAHNRGTTIPSLVKTDLLNIKLSIPSISVQEALLVKFSALHIETQRLESLYQRKLQALDDLKKSLLHQAFGGVL